MAEPTSTDRPRRRRITRDQAREIFAKHGIKEAPPDDPIYREEPTIHFTTRPPKPRGPVHEDDQGDDRVARSSLPE